MNKIRNKGSSELVQNRMTPESIFQKRKKKNKLLYFGLVPIPLIGSIIGFYIYFFLIEEHDSETRALLMLCLIFFILPIFALIEYFVRDNKLNRLRDSIQNPPGDLIWVFIEQASASIIGKKYARFIKLFYYFKDGKGSLIGISNEEASFLMNWIIKNCPGVSYGWSKEMFQKFKKDPSILQTEKIQTNAIRYMNVRAQV